MALTPDQESFVEAEITNLSDDIAGYEQLGLDLPLDNGDDQDALNEQLYNTYNNLCIEVETERKNLDGKMVTSAEEIDQAQIDLAADGETCLLFPITPPGWDGEGGDSYQGIDIYEASGLNGGTGTYSGSEQVQLGLEQIAIETILGVTPPFPPATGTDQIIYNEAVADMRAAQAAQITAITLQINSCNDQLPLIAAQYGETDAYYIQTEEIIPTKEGAKFNAEWAYSMAITTASLETRLQQIYDRVAEIPARASDMNAFLGDFTTGVYYTRYNFLNFRLRRSGGTLREKRLQEQSDTLIEQEMNFKRLKRSFYLELLD